MSFTTNHPTDKDSKTRTVRDVYANSWEKENRPEGGWPCSEIRLGAQGKDEESGKTLTPSETGDSLRLDDGKPRMDLIPPEAMLALGSLYAAGAAKYKPRGWEDGMDWGRCVSALERHLQVWKAGEDYDDGEGGSNAHHMINVAWNAIALFTYNYRGIGTDDRF